MKRKLANAVLLTIIIAAFIVGVAGISTGQGEKGQALFQKHCAICHPDGGNIVNPKKTLHLKDRLANGVKKASDIVHIMRNPGPGMTKFDAKTLPDKDAKEIAEYEMKTFK